MHDNLFVSVFGLLGVYMANQLSYKQLGELFVDKTGFLVGYVGRQHRVPNAQKWSSIVGTQFDRYYLLYCLHIIESFIFGEFLFVRYKQNSEKLQTTIVDFCIVSRLES